MRKGKKGWAGWIPKTDVDRLCLDGSREWERGGGRGDGQEGGWEALQARLEEAAAEVKATATATRNKIKFNIPDENQEDGDGRGDT